MGQEASIPLTADELEAKIEDMAQERALKEAQATHASTSTDTLVDDKPKELDPKLLFGGNYTELKFTQQKQYLKWKTVTLKHKGSRDVKATLGRYQIRVDRIYGLASSDDGLSFTIYALGPRDDTIVEHETFVQRMKHEGKEMVKRVYKSLPFSTKEWYQNEYVFETQTPEQAADWLDELSQVTDTEWAERDMMIVMNPNQDKNASKALKDLLPMFEAANVVVHVKTTHKVQETVYNAAKLTEYKHLIVLGGDLTFHQAINGLLTRPDFDRVVSRCVLGAIPAGEGNSISKYLGVSHPYLSTLNVIRGVPQPLDVMSVTNPTGFRMFSHLNLNWGLLADLQMEPDMLKWTQWFGLDLKSIQRVISPKFYEGTIHYLPITDDETLEEGLQAPMQIPVSDAERLAKPGPIDHYTKIDPQFLPEKWETVKAVFSLLFATNVPLLTKKLVAAPLAITSDGAVDLAYTQGGLFAFAPWLLFPNRGAHMHLPNWNFKRVRAFILEPGNDVENKPGHLTVDGEKIPYTSIRAEVHKGLVKLITPTRKVQSKGARWKANIEKWGSIVDKPRWEMITMEAYKHQVMMRWVLAFGFLITLFAYAVQL